MLQQGGNTVNVALDYLGETSVEPISSFDSNDGSITQFTFEYEVTDGQGEVSAPAQLTIDVTDILVVPLVGEGPEYNISFLIDASDSPVLDQIGFGLFADNLNNKDVANTKFDLMPDVLKGLLIDFTQADVGAGVDVGIFSSESDLDADDPENRVTQLDAGLIGVDLSTGADLSGIFDNAAALGRCDGNPALDSGVAVFGAANGFFTNNDAADNNPDAQNLEFILSDSFAEAGPQFDAELPELTSLFDATDPANGGNQANVIGVTTNFNLAFGGLLADADSDGFVTFLGTNPFTGQMGTIRSMIDDLIVESKHQAKIKGARIAPRALFLLVWLTRVASPPLMGVQESLPPRPSGLAALRANRKSRPFPHGNQDNRERTRRRSAPYPAGPPGVSSMTPQSHQGRW